jgi:hypothetical protein
MNAYKVIKIAEHKGKRSCWQRDVLSEGVMKKSIILLLGVALANCQGFNSIKSAFTQHSAYEQYVESLEKAGLFETTMVQMWLEEGQRAFMDSIVINTPFSESGHFNAAAVRARSYRFRVHEGQRLSVSSVARATGGARMFVDLFLKDGNKWERFHASDSSATITQEFTSDEECVLRLQPELLADCFYAVSITIAPALPNPVYGASNRAIGSFYGAPRDKGKRHHEGVDIFAIRGTPVLAPTDGEITKVAVTPLGGKVVWLRDNRRHQSYYFAHLDSQMVKPGMRVFQGYVLGLVGKTGNAWDTPPHLHFGIYEERSKDPLYYILAENAATDTVQIDTTFKCAAFKVRVKKAGMMVGPSSRMPCKIFLARDTYVTAIGQSGNWVRVALPDRSQGYILKNRLAPLANGTLMKIDSATMLLSEIGVDAVPVATLGENTSVEVLAHFKDYAFVRTKNGKAGWLDN